MSFPRYRPGDYSQQASRAERETRSVLLRMRLNDMVVEHSINTKTDATHFDVASNEDGSLREVVRIDSSANMYLVKGDQLEQYGQFHLDSDHLWYYTYPDGREVHTGNKDLLKAEVKVFKELIVLGVLKLKTEGDSDGTQVQEGDGPKQGTTTLT